MAWVWVVSRGELRGFGGSKRPEAAAASANCRLTRPLEESCFRDEWPQAQNQLLWRTLNPKATHRKSIQQRTLCIGQLSSGGFTTAWTPSKVCGVMALLNILNGFWAIIFPVADGRVLVPYRAQVPNQGGCRPIEVLGLIRALRFLE